FWGKTRERNITLSPRRPLLRIQENVMKMLRYVLTTLLLASALPSRAADGYLLQQHDLRVMADISLWQNALETFYGITYGDTIQLGEFGCGNPHFLVHINEPVKFRLTGQVNKVGSYFVIPSLDTGLLAKIYEECFLVKDPSIGGTIKAFTRLDVLGPDPTLTL